MFDLPPVVDAAARAACLTILALEWILVLVRLVGLRTFSKMTSFDFIVTLATGSLLASAVTAVGWPAFVQALAAATALLLLQYLLAMLRRRSRAIAAILGNQPLLLMRDGTVIDDALAISRVSRQDIAAKLREANVTALSRVRAVVLETTGDISVLHGGSLDPAILNDVRDPGAAS